MSHFKCNGDIKKNMECYERYNWKINLLRKLKVNKVDVYNKPEIADAFNDFFTNIGQKLASQIPKSTKTFETYINKVNVIMDSKPLPVNELKHAFFSLTLKNALGCFANQ